MSPTLLRSETLVSQGQAGAAEHRRRRNVGRSDTTEIGGGPFHVDVTRMTRRAMRDARCEARPSPTTPPESLTASCEAGVKPPCSGELTRPERGSRALSFRRARYGSSTGRRPGPAPSCAEWTRGVKAPPYCIILQQLHHDNHYNAITINLPTCHKTYRLHWARQQILHVQVPVHPLSEQCRPYMIKP